MPAGSALCCVRGPSRSPSEPLWTATAGCRANLLVWQVPTLPRMAQTYAALQCLQYLLFCTHTHTPHLQPTTEHFQCGLTAGSVTDLPSRCPSSDVLLSRFLSPPLQNFSRCNCIRVNKALGYANPGSCGSGCSHFLVPFVALACVSGFVASIAHTPAFVMILR